MDTVVSYWSLNKTYIIITILVLSVFAYSVAVLHTMFIVEVASHGNCDDPWALYLNDGIRNKCISTKQSNELKSQQAQFERDTEAIAQNISRIKTKIQETDAMHDELQRRIQERNAQKWANVKQTITDLSGTVVSIQTKYRENKDALEKIINDYDTAIQTNAELLVQVGNNLVKKLTQNVYTPNWAKQRGNLVDAYNTILEYFAKTADAKTSGSTANPLQPLSAEVMKGKKQ
jgi:septal ring factor EnvC (AmiA/AmiB activator)